MSKAQQLAGYQVALKTALIEFTDGDDAIAVADAGVVTLLTTAVAKSEGGAATTNIAQGLAKSWTHFELAGTASVRDSFNHASFTDNATGDATIAITAAMGNINFAHVGMAGAQANSLIAVMQQRNQLEPTTTVSRYQVGYADGSLYDAIYVAVALLGDMA